MIRSVLLHTDIRSPEAPMVLGLAEGLRQIGVERVVLANVVDASGMEGPVIAARVDHVRGLLREAASPLRQAGYDVEIRTPTGDAESELIALSAEAGVDAILSGSHGKSNLERLFMGSVSEALAARATVPNIIVRFDLITASDDVAAPMRDLCRTLVVPTDFSEAADRALDLALGLPSECTKRIVLVHVEDGAGDVDIRLRARADQARATGIDAVYVARRGDVARSVLAEVVSHAATCVIVGTRGRTPWEEVVLGSVSLTLLREAPCPIVIVP